MDNFTEVVVVSDYDDEMNRNDPVEDQCLLILRDDENPQQMIPNKEEMDKLEKYLKKPNIEEMKEEERTLIWRFRHPFFFNIFFYLEGGGGSCGVIILGV